MLEPVTDLATARQRYVEYMYTITPVAQNREEESDFKRSMRKLHRSARDPTCNYPTRPPLDLSWVYAIPLHSNALNEANWASKLESHVALEIAEFINDAQRRGVTRIVLQCNDGVHKEADIVPGDGVVTTTINR